MRQPTIPSRARQQAVTFPSRARQQAVMFPSRARQQAVMFLVALMCGAAIIAADCNAAPANEKQTARQADTDAKIIAEEDALEQALPLDQRPKRCYKGRLALYPDGPAANAPGVYGSLATERDGTFLVKVARPEVASELKKYDRQSVTLEGSVRVQGKYLVVERVYVPQPGPKRMARGKSGGG